MTCTRLPGSKKYLLYIVSVRCGLTAQSKSDNLPYAERRTRADPRQPQGRQVGVEGVPAGVLVTHDWTPCRDMSTRLSVVRAVLSNSSHGSFAHQWTQGDVKEGVLYKRVDVEDQKVCLGDRKEFDKEKGSCPFA